jgi:hypothetical protein
MRKPDFDVFLEKFKPIERNEGNYMYETYGEDLKTVLTHLEEIGHQYVWTVLDVGNGKLYLSPGYHYVNRLGYVLTTVPFEEGQRDYKY